MRRKRIGKKRRQRVRYTRRRRAIGLSGGVTSDKDAMRKRVATHQEKFSTQERERIIDLVCAASLSDDAKLLVEVGKKAGVVVNPKTKKCASAHDLRRAFGQRWATRVMPQILMQLMRHSDITTTMKYYVGSEAETTADVLWDAIAKEESNLGTILGTRRKRPIKKPL